MSKLRESIERNYHLYSTIAILSAFIFDSLTLVRVDLYLTNLLLFIYLAVVGTGIILINLHEDKRISFISDEAYQWIFIAMQFAFGGLFGRLLIHYSRSGSLIASWPFLLILLALLITNEFAKKYYTRLVLQLDFFFLALFTYLIFLVPVLLGRMGDDVFLISGYFSVLIILSFLYILSKLVPRRVNERSRALFISIGFIFLLINLLYFTNIIPPIPLALREAVVYHSVIPRSGGYQVAGEVDPPFAAFFPYRTIHLVAGDTASVYSAVFAPTNFDTSIIHNWQHYDDASGTWQSVSKVTLPIVGGRDNGYRGYSIKNNISSGFWRVIIETLRGQAIGQIEFKVEYVESEPELINETL